MFILTSLFCLAGEGSVRLVYGKYAYHHYMQDRFDDDKWGCVISGAAPTVPFKH